MGIKIRASQYFVSSAVSAVLALFTLPLTTRILGPRDYGLLALGTTIAGIGATLAVLGIDYVVANRWPNSARDERTTLVSTVLVFGEVIVLAWSVGATVLVAVFRSDAAFLRELPFSGLLISMAAAVLAPVWSVATAVLTVEGRARAYSAIIVVQSVVTAGVTLLALYAFHVRTNSLFIGLFAGSAVGCVFGLYVLRDYAAMRFDRFLRRELAQTQFLLAMLTESTQPFLERVLLSRFSGFAELGLYTHSQRYRALALQGTNAVGKAVWPVSLDEARVTDGSFPVTGRTWNVVHVATACLGIALTAFGDRMISLLTHGKFTHAWVFLPAWFIMLLLQLSAKPEVATVYAYGLGRTVARVSVVANVVALAATAVLIPLIGVWGAVTALLVQALAYRIVVRIPARRLRRVPFQDTWAVAGCVLIGIVWALKSGVASSLTGSAVVFAIAEVGFLLLAAPVLATTVRSLQRWRPEPS